MHPLTKSEFMKMVINDKYKKLSKKNLSDREFMGFVSESIVRCKRESRFKNPRITGQR